MVVVVEGCLPFVRPPRLADLGNRLLQRQTLQALPWLVGCGFGSWMSGGRGVEGMVGRAMSASIQQAITPHLEIEDVVRGLFNPNPSSNPSANPMHLEVEDDVVQSACGGEQRLRRQTLLWVAAVIIVRGGRGGSRYMWFSHSMVM